ncbi:MAG: hypothetical protein V3V26_00115 [Candidatus Aenigmarchaeota archaeon]
MAKQDMAKEMVSLKAGLKNLAMEAHKEHYGRLLERVDSGLEGTEALKEEFSSFVTEIRNNREAIEKLRMDIASMRSQIRGEVPEGGIPAAASDMALLTRDIETLKTRIKWLESKATLPNIDSLRARVEALENQLGSIKMAVPIVIE